MSTEEIEYIEEESSLITQGEEALSVTQNEDITAIDKTIKDDFNFARENIKSIVTTGMMAVENLTIIANNSEHPRIFECLTNLLQINALNNTMLLDLDSKMKDMIGGKDDKNSRSKVVNNNTIFVKTTTDIQQMVEENIKKSLNGKND